uniref:Uncharacterized protein n=1 Tax=Hyaloperonospora arabidopsidis (strain Emoy2) TaxID=559515 RepID=M4B8Z6_HYAAE
MEARGPGGGRRVVVRPAAVDTRRRGTTPIDWRSTLELVLLLGTETRADGCRSAVERALSCEDETVPSVRWLRRDAALWKDQLSSAHDQSPVHVAIITTRKCPV